MGNNIRHFRELDVDKMAIEAAMEIFELTKHFPVEERYSMIDQIRKSSRSVCANIAEAWRKRRYPAAFVSKLSDAKRRPPRPKSGSKTPSAVAILSRPTMPDSSPPPASVSPRPPLRVLIADDHPLMVDALCSLLEAHGIEVAGTVGEGRAAVEQALRLEPNLVLMDIRMPVCDGLAATRLIKAQRPEIKVLIITTSAEDKDLFEAIKSGACGYLLKSTSGRAFIEALHGLEQGIPPFSPGLAERLLREFARLAETGKDGDRETRGGGDTERGGKEDDERVRLTERQMEVLRLVSAGLTYKEVGVKLNLSEATVRYHMSEIMHLLHLEHRSQVIAYAAKLGLG